MAGHYHLSKTDLTNLQRRSIRCSKKRNTDFDAVDYFYGYDGPKAKAERNLILKAWDCRVERFDPGKQKDQLYSGPPARREKAYRRAMAGSSGDLSRPSPASHAWKKAIKAIVAGGPPGKLKEFLGVIRPG